MRPTSSRRRSTPRSTGRGARTAIDAAAARPTRRAPSTRRCARCAARHGAHARARPHRPRRPRRGLRRDDARSPSRDARRGRATRRELAAVHGEPLGAEAAQPQRARRGRHGQARRRRAQRLLRHRPRLPLSGGRRDRGAARRSQPRVLRPARPAADRRAATTRTADGYVFRVDMRLRPYGDSGPLTMRSPRSRTTCVTQGRDWERYAWLKARALTGDAATTSSTRSSRRSSTASTSTSTRIAGLRDAARADPRSRSARRDCTRQRQAGPGRHPRDRVHRPGAADRARRARAGAARAPHAARRSRRSRARGLLPEPAAAALTRRLRVPAQPRAPAAVPRRRADAGAARRRRRERDALARAMGFARRAAFDAALDAHRAAVDAQFEPRSSARRRAMPAPMPQWRSACGCAAATGATSTPRPLERRSRSTIRRAAALGRRAGGRAGARVLALPRSRSAALRRAGAAHARRRHRGPVAGTRGAGDLRAPALAARDGRAPERLPRAADRAPAADRRGWPTDRRVRVGGRLPDARIRSCSTSCSTRAS